MGFGDLKSNQGLQALNSYLEDKSYIEGYVPSQADGVVFEAVGKAPASNLSHALRWYNQIDSYGAERSKFAGQKKDVSVYGTSGTASGGGGDDADDDDDFDLFDDDEEDAAEAEKLKQERIAEYQAKKAKKPALIAKSNIILDVKPWDDETDMAEIETFVREIKMDGLLWGTAKLVAIGYGIKKLRICCVVEDDKVSVDDLQELITANEELIQSTDIAGFNKI